MTNSALASYAILKENWEQPERRDYLDNFVVIVAEAIRQVRQDTVSLNDVQQQVATTFGLQLPQNTLRTLLVRVKRKGYIRIENNVYVCNHDALAKLNFREIQRHVLQAHESLVQSLIKFAADLYSKTWSEAEAEHILEKYLQRNQIQLLVDLTNPNGNADQMRPLDAQQNYVCAKFIQSLHETNSTKLEYLETIVKGNLLANSVFLTDPSNFQRRFRGTSVFLDAPIVIFAL